LHAGQAFFAVGMDLSRSLFDSHSGAPRGHLDSLHARFLDRTPLRVSKVRVDTSFGLLVLGSRGIKDHRDLEVHTIGLDTGKRIWECLER
jgi:hypothetical protein